MAGEFSSPVPAAGASSQVLSPVQPSNTLGQITQIGETIGSLFGASRQASVGQEKLRSKVLV